MENQEFVEKNKLEDDFDPQNPFGLTTANRAGEVFSLLMIGGVLLGSFLKVLFF